MFREVAAGAVNFGVVPVENSTEGAVNHALDSFLEHDMVICGEVELRILLTCWSAKPPRPTTSPGSIPMPNPRAMSQVAGLAHYPSVERVAVSSNADAAKRVKSEWNSAAMLWRHGGQPVRPEQAAREDRGPPGQLHARFLIIGNQEVPPTGDDKTSIIVSMRNKPGALHELLVPFHNNGIDLTRIETRPSRSGFGGPTCSSSISSATIKNR